LICLIYLFTKLTKMYEIKIPLCTDLQLFVLNLNLKKVQLEGRPPAGLKEKGHRYRGLYHAVIAQYFVNKRHQFKRETGSVYQLSELNEIAEGKGNRSRQACMMQRNKIAFIGKVEQQLPEIYGMNMFPEKKEVADREFPAELLEVQNNRVSQITLEGLAFGSTVELC